MHVSPDHWNDLADRLNRSPLAAQRQVLEIRSWRVNAFKRFHIGTLPDGKEELLEFWRENHLLDPHRELPTRAEIGWYGLREISFLGLSDLIRSKETERDSDWADVARLEEFLDQKLQAKHRSGEILASEALRNLRSRSGFFAHFQEGALRDRPAVETALGETTNPITQACLLPFAPEVQLSQ